MTHVKLEAKDNAYAEKIDRELDKRFPDHDSIVTNLVWAARDAGIQLSLACGLIEQESGFKNVFGHDPTIYSGAGKVTRDKYRAYKRARGTTRMQGVGPAQLTWYELQDEADRLGGCWNPRWNMLVGFRHLRSLIDSYGLLRGLARYNGSGPAAWYYALSVRRRALRWHNILT